MASADESESLVAANQALLIALLRQHELMGELAEANNQLQLEITARELIARDLAEKARLLDITNDAIMVRDQQDRISSWNRGAERLYGWTSDEVVGKDLHTVMHTEFPKPMEEIVAQLYREGSFSGDVVQLAKDGRRIHTFCRWVLDPPTGAILTSYTDNTERRLVQLALHESEARFRMLANAIPQLAWNALPDGTITWFNQRWYDYTGTTPQQMEDGGWRNVHHPDELPWVAKLWESSLRSGEPFEMTFPLKGADGAFRPFLTRVTPHCNEHGKIVCWFGTNTDVYEIERAAKELREAKDAAEAANQSKDHFLAVLSHELRTPLTPVLLAASSMQKDKSLSPEALENMEMIVRNVRLEAKLIDDLLDVTRIISGKMELSLEPVDLNKAILESVGICRERIDEKGLLLETSLDANVGILTADMLRIQQVLWNLLNNAIKFTPERGTVQISAKRLRPDSCEVRVQDSGIGIGPEALSRIFEPFEQSDRDVTRRYGGLGLGLAISRAVVESHGGTIRAESKGPGMGATFIIKLPWANSQNGSRSRDGTR
jgi:hypothetical protein